MEEQFHVEKRGNRYYHSLRRDGKSVSSLDVVDLQMRVGAGRVRMGGVACVGTPDEERGKGYSRRLLEHNCQWMAQEGFDCSLLFGITDYYQKFDYAVCLPESRIEVAVRHAEHAPQTLEKRLYRAEDLPAVQRLYESYNNRQTGTIVRGEGTEWFRRGSQHMRKSRVFVFEEAGAVVAYTAFDETRDANPIRHEMVCSELAVMHPRHYNAILCLATEIAIERRLEKIAFLCPPQGDCVAYLSLWGAEQAIHYPAGQEGMGRFLNLKSFFSKTLTEWNLRVRDSVTLRPQTALRLLTEIGEITLVWNGQELQIGGAFETLCTVDLPQHCLFQLAMGYMGAEVAGSLPEIQIEGDETLFRTLFPRRLPYIWQGDHF